MGPMTHLQLIVESHRSIELSIAPLTVITFIPKRKGVEGDNLMAIMVAVFYTRA